jgi:hypothetical protein
LAFDGLTNEQIAERIGCERHAVGPWRRRWAGLRPKSAQSCRFQLDTLGSQMEPS